MKKKPNYMKICENKSHSEKKLENFERSLASARRNADRQQSQVNQLKNELAAAIKAKEDYEKEYEKGSQSRGGLQLTKEQVSSLVSMLLIFNLWLLFLARGVQSIDWRG